MKYRLQEDARRRPAKATLLIDVKVTGARIVPGIEVRRHRDTHLDGRLRHVVKYIPLHAGSFDTPLATDSMMLRFAQKMIVKALEDWTHVIPAPAGEAQLTPVIIISRLSAHRNHGIDRGRTADPLAPRILQRPAVKARFALCLEHPVRPRIANGEKIADRNMKPDPVVVATGFQNQNTAVASGLPTVCNDPTSRSS